MDTLPFNNIIVGKPPFIIIASSYVMLVLAAYSIHEKRLIYKRKKFITIGTSIFINILSIIIHSLFSVTMLDVSQGESIVGVYKNNSFLVDGGGNIFSNDEDNFSTGENIVLPYLKSMGVKNLDFVFVSHNDADHIGGIIDIIGKIPISYVFVSSLSVSNDNYMNLLQVCSKNNVPIYRLNKGDFLTLGNDIRFDILHPSDTLSELENNNSLVFKLTYKNNTMLFTGDIEIDVEKHLLETTKNLEADILKVAHHGSSSSSYVPFIKKVNPKACIISCGKNNVYGHPHKETLYTLSKENIDTFSTNINNAIRIYFNNSSFKIKKY